MEATRCIASRKSCLHLHYGTKKLRTAQFVAFNRNFFSVSFSEKLSRIYWNDQQLVQIQMQIHAWIWSKNSEKVGK